MPIRFRCPHCTRLLGIATRKAGTDINCPQCGRPLTVPVQDDRNLDDVSELLSANLAGGPPPDATQPLPEPARPVTEAPRPPAAAKAPPAAKPAARPKRPRTGGDDDPLFEHDDVDELLGMKRPAVRYDLDDPEPKVKPVSGLDAHSLDSGDGKLVLTTQKATMLVVAVVILLGLAFAAGFVIASKL